MSPRALILDQYAIGTLSNSAISEDWFENYAIPIDVKGLRRVNIGDCIYILSDRADESTRLLVINTSTSNVLNIPNSKRHLFSRILQVALVQFERGRVNLPVSWKSYRDSLRSSRLSIYALTAAMGEGQRLYFETAPRHTNHVYAYALTQNVADFDDVVADNDVFSGAWNNYVDALLAQPSPPDERGGALGIVLTPTLGSILVGNATLEEWYNRRLTKEQRAFVDKDHSAPVRLKGSAGTGKTVSMAIKCLRDVYRLDDEGANARVAFVTHSSALAYDVLPSMFYGLDPTHRWTQLKTAQLWLGSVYELAQDLLQYKDKGLKPLSTDGREGREFQQMLIDSAIKDCFKNTAFIQHLLPACSLDFQERVRSSNLRESFVNELANEFASVIDAEFIRLGKPEAARYLEDTREVWQMPLPTSAERSVVLRIHEAYCQELERSSTLSMDQMIADLSRYLTSHEWRQLRDRQGFSVIFIDELHYFNRAERMIFHSLFKSQAMTMGRRVPLFMAYDLKQSPSDVFMRNSRLDGAGNIFKSVGAGETDLVELKSIFRSTPQIASFLTDLDASFPALDLEDEWGRYASDVRTESGPTPQLKVYASSQSLIDDVYARAGVRARDIGGWNVAVLCLSERLFDIYRQAGRIANKHIVISGRDQIADLRYAGGRVILSMPEYVAGLQFENVFLIHIDRVEQAEDSFGVGPQRRFISRCYLGASRATRELFVASASDRGGPAAVLDGPLGRKSLQRAL